MLDFYKENNYEKSIIQLFQEMEYTYIPGTNITFNNNIPFYMDKLKEALYKINPTLPNNAIEYAINKLQNIENGDLVQKNAVFMDYLQNGIEIRYIDKNKEHSTICNIIDYNKQDNNSFIITNQLTFRERKTKRIDVLLFINGLPLVLMELKSPSREEINTSEAYNQIKNYMEYIPSMFVYNAICIISNFAKTCAGTITSQENRFMEWKSENGTYDNTQFAKFVTLFKGMFQKDRLLDILKNFILFSNDGLQSTKILACYHQYFAVRKAIESTKRAINTDHKGGVFWHTQGSGKSISMVFYAHLLQYELESPTIVVITDRNELDEQLYSQFAKCKNFLRQEPKQAQSREHLKELLNKRKANGIIFTTMQKFEDLEEPFSKRKNIIVISDEAHRGQYGLIEKIKTIKNNQEEFTAKKVIGMALMIRNALPNATYIGFTGTPISEKDRNTREVFGNYIDTYDMTQAIEDGATRPIYYESRIMKLRLDEDILNLIDEEYKTMANNADSDVIEKSKHKLGKMEAILGNEHTIKSLVDDILNHYENHREHLLTGKAMIVAYSRAIAIKIYKRILEIRPGWEEKIAIVITSSDKDPQDWNELIGNEYHREKLAIKFKDNQSPLKIAIVVDMWLTGFDIPSLATMYIYKPMVGHNLMQAIARVNRVFDDKEGGLIVDYVNIASALKQAINDYTARDRENYSNMDIVSVAYPRLQEKLSICRNILQDYDYSAFFDGNELIKGKLIIGAVNFIMDRNRMQQRELYLQEALILKQTLSLCSSIANKKECMEATFFEAVRVVIIKILNISDNKKLSLFEVDKKINELLKHSIKIDGIISLFPNKGKTLSLSDPIFLEQISKMEEKNLSIELLDKIITEEITNYKRTNIVKSEKFSEIMKNLMACYYKKVLDNEEVIQEMLNIIQQINTAKEAAEKFGLTEQELAVYDILMNAQDNYNKDQCIVISKKIMDKINKDSFIDWKQREQIKATLRIEIKKILKSFHYPGESISNIINRIIEQMEFCTDDSISA